MEFVMKKVLYVFSFLLLAFAFGCSSSTDSNPTGDLQNDVFGTWTVTRTLVSGSSSFPQGYQDIQTWKITKSGSAA